MNGTLLVAGAAILYLLSQAGKSKDIKWQKAPDLLKYDLIGQTMGSGGNFWEYRIKPHLADQGLKETRQEPMIPIGD